MSRTPRPWCLALALLGCDLTPAPGPLPLVAQHVAPPAPVTAPTSSPPAPAPAPAGVVAGIHYIEVLTGGARAEERLPLVVAIHGYGDSPEGFVGLLAGLPARARVVALRGLDPAGDGFAWFPPGSAQASGIRRAADAVAAALPDLARRRPTCGLPIVTGFSQGGMLAFALAGRSPSVVRAAAPLGGRLPPALLPSARPLGGLLPEVHALHGEADPRVPIAGARAAVEGFRQAGFPADLAAYPGVGHAVTQAMQQDLLRWLSDVIRRSGCP